MSGTERYEAVALGGPVFEITEFEVKRSTGGEDVEFPSKTYKIQADVAVKQVSAAEIKVKNAKAIVAAIKLAAAVAAKETAEKVKKQTEGTPTE